MPTSQTRRELLNTALTTGAIASTYSLGALASRMQAKDLVKTTQVDARGFFTLGKRKNHWWLITPDGKPFFTMGLNHIDPASLRYPENLKIWRDKYKGSTLNWIENSVAPNLKAWGFNSVGWVQEVTVRHWRHSRAFTVDEYKKLKMPYCHLLPFTESHQWEKHTVHYDFRSEDWREWCDYVARSHCAELSDDPNLIGYFYSDCPCWIHDRPVNKWRGPMFDPDRLKSEAGKKELAEIATAYYKTAHDAIRRYDKHHLLLGDRYEANAPIAMEVINSARPYIDVFSFQDFRDPVKHLDHWHKVTGKPVLLADSAGTRDSNGRYLKAINGYKPNNGQWYADTLKALHQNPGCIGFHLCGAYQRNKARQRGLLDEMEHPDMKEIKLMKAANEQITAWMAEQFN